MMFYFDMYIVMLVCIMKLSLICFCHYCFITCNMFIGLYFYLNYRLFSIFYSCVLTSFTPKLTPVTIGGSSCGNWNSWHDSVWGVMQGSSIFQGTRESEYLRRGWILRQYGTYTALRNCALWYENRIILILTSCGIFVMLLFCCVWTWFSRKLLAIFEAITAFMTCFRMIWITYCDISGCLART